MREVAAQYDHGIPELPPDKAGMAFPRVLGENINVEVSGIRDVRWSDMPLTWAESLAIWKGRMRRRVRLLAGKNRLILNVASHGACPCLVFCLSVTIVLRFVKRRKAFSAFLCNIVSYLFFSFFVEVGNHLDMSMPGLLSSWSS